MSAPCQRGASMGFAMKFGRTMAIVAMLQPSIEHRAIDPMRALHAAKRYFGIALIAVVLVTGGSVVSFTHAHAQAANSAATSEVTEGQTANGNGDSGIAAYTFWLMLFTGALVGATIALAYIAWLQRADTRITQRAYLSVAPLGVAPLNERGVAHLSVRNVGKLPAHDVSWLIATEADENGKRSNFPVDESKFYAHGFVIQPGAEMKRSQDFHLTESQLGDFKDRTQRRRFLYVWGELRYLDGFGRRRFTRFCHRYDSRGYMEAPIGERHGGHDWIITAESSRSHQFGNDAD